ncbi:MAG: hypothetical protein R3F14_10150 [Polyangiaceae bacterium]
MVGAGRSRSVRGHRLRRAARVDARDGGAVGRRRIGAEWSFAPSWSIGTTLRYSNWFFPESPKPLPLGDPASLSGRVDILALSVSLAYHIALCGGARSLFFDGSGARGAARVALRMAIDTSLVGAESATHTFTYDWKTLAAYALGIGAKKDELAYLYEGTPGGIRVFPTFAVVPAFAPSTEMLLKTGPTSRWSCTARSRSASTARCRRKGRSRRRRRSAGSTT